MQVSVAQLSKVNAHAAAAPAGNSDALSVDVSVAEGLRASRLSGRQVQTSLQDSVSFLRVADDSLAQSEAVLQRVRVVASQASEGAYDESQRQAMQKYFDRSVQELDALAERARYNATHLLNGTPVSPLPPLRRSFELAPAPLPREAMMLPSTSVGSGRSHEPAVMQTVQPQMDASIPAPAASTAPSAPAAIPAVSTGASAPDVVAQAGATYGVSVQTPQAARDAMGRIDQALAVVGESRTAVAEASTSLAQTMREVGTGSFGRPEERARPDVTPTSAPMRMARLQQAAQTSASVLVSSTQAQFQAVNLVMGGFGAAAGVLAPPQQAPAPMPTRPSVEAVSASASSARSSARGAGGGSAGV